MLIYVNVKNLIYTSLFCLFFVLCYFVIIGSRLEQLFKQGSTWQIRAAQLILSFISSYFVTEGIMSLINSMQF